MVGSYESKYLAEMIHMVFLEDKIIEMDWEEIFYEILPIIYNFIPIVLEYQPTEGKVELCLQHHYSKLSESDFMLFIRDSSYHLIVVAIPYIFARRLLFEKTIFTYDDHIIKIFEKLIERKKQESLFTYSKIIVLDYVVKETLTFAGQAYALVLNKIGHEEDSIYVSIEKTRIMEVEQHRFEWQNYSFKAAITFLKEFYLKEKVTIAINKIYCVGEKVVAYETYGFVNFVDAKVEDFVEFSPDIEYWNYMPQIIVNAKPEYEDPLYNEYIDLMNHRNEYVIFKQKMLKETDIIKVNYKLGNPIPKEYEKYDAEFTLALLEELSNPLKHKLFEQGLVTFDSLYLNKHINENIFVHVKK